MVQYIPGPEQLLAPAAAQITEGVLNFLNPHRQFQQAVQAAIAQNPDIAQHFANLEASSPGLLRNMGIGRLADIPATAEKQFEIKNREAIIQGKEANLAAETSKNLFTQEQMQHVLRAMQEKPELGYEGAVRLITGNTPTEAIIKKNQAELGGLEIQGVKSALPAQIAEDQFKLQSLQETQNLLQSGPEVTMQKFLRNEYTPKQLLGIFASPLGKALEKQLDFYNDQLRISMMSGRGDDAFERLKYGRAFDLFTKLADPNISIDDVMRYLNRGPGEIADPDDPSAKAIQEGLTRLNTGATSAIIQNLDRDLTSALINFKNTQAKTAATKGPAGDDARTLIAKQIDDILEQKARLPGQQRYKASYELVPRRFARDQKELVFRGPDGKIVDASAALAGAPVTPQTSPSTVKEKSGKEALGPLPPNMLNAMVADYNKASPGEKQAMLARWRAEAPADAFKQIQAALGIK